jgi:hypothetical protein
MQAMILSGAAGDAAAMTRLISRCPDAGAERSLPSAVMT